MIKITPTILMANLWRSALFLLRELANEAGRYVSYRQPTSQVIRKFQRANRRNNDEEWE